MSYLTRVISAARTRTWTVAGRLLLQANGVRFGSRLRCYGMPIVTLEDNSSVELGDDVVLCSDSRYTALGVSHPVIVRTLRPGARISIGSRCGFSGSTLCAALQITIGDECLFGADVAVFDTDFHALKPKGRRFNSSHADIDAAPIVIGNNVFIGVGARIAKGVTIGDNSVIGAAAMVVRDIPPNVVAAGNPAVVIRRLEEREPRGRPPEPQALPWK